MRRDIDADTSHDKPGRVPGDNTPAHRRKQRIPPGVAAQAAAAVLTGTTSSAASTVTDLAAYARAAQGRNTLT